MSSPALDRMLRATALFDLYGGLLTERQREFFDLHYMRDLSLAEISEQYGVSRQSVHDTLVRAESCLESAEASLHLLERIEAARRAVDRASGRCLQLRRVCSDHGDHGEEASPVCALVEQLSQDLSCIADLLSPESVGHRD